MHLDWTVIWSVGSFASVAHISFYFFRNYRCMQFFVLLCHQFIIFTFIWEVQPLSIVLTWTSGHRQDDKDTSEFKLSVMVDGPWQLSSWHSIYDESAIVVSPMLMHVMIAACNYVVVAQQLRFSFFTLLRFCKCLGVDAFLSPNHLINSWRFRGEVICPSPSLALVCSPPWTVW